MQICKLDGVQKQQKLMLITSTTVKHGMTGVRADGEFLDYGVLHPAGPDAASQRHPEQ
jgi:hypothetical protein